MSKHVLYLEKEINKKNLAIEKLENDKRKLYEKMDVQSVKTRQAEFSAKKLSYEMNVLKTQIENGEFNIGGDGGDGGSQLLDGDTNNIDANDSSVLFLGETREQQILLTPSENGLPTDVDVDDSIHTQTWSEAATIMFHLLDLDMDGYISKSEIIRATTSMNSHSYGGDSDISIQLNKLIRLMRLIQSFPKSLNTPVF